MISNPGKWKCESNCPDLIALNVKIIDTGRRFEFRCLYCGKPATYWTKFPLPPEIFARRCGLGSSNLHA